MLWTLIGTALVFIVLAWRLVPVGKLNGRTVKLGELVNANTRLHLKLQKAEAALKSCEELPPQERPVRLLELEREFGQVFVAGHKVRRAFVATGSDAVVRHFQRIVQSPGGEVDMISGIREALEAGRVQSGYRVHAFECLLDRLNDSISLGLSRAQVPGLLLQLDKDRAARVLCGSAYLDASHDVFGDILAALTQHQVTLARPQIDSWLRHYQGRSLDRAEGCEYAEVLKTLHAHDHVLAEKLLREEMNKNTAASEPAAEVLLLIHDLPHPVFSLSDLEEKVGFDALTRAEKTVWLATTYGYLMSRDSLSQLDDDDRADLMAETLRALEEIGAARHAKQLADYMALYGAAGVPATAAARTAFIKKAGSGWRQSVESIQARYNDLEAIGLLTLRFEIAHAGDIRTRSVIRKLLAAEEQPGLDAV